MLKEHEVKKVWVTCVCDECKKGEMRGLGMKNMSIPATYPHKCNKCGSLKDYEEMQPCFQERVEDQSQKKADNY